MDGCSLDRSKNTRHSELHNFPAVQEIGKAKSAVRDTRSSPVSPYPTACCGKLSREPFSEKRPDQTDRGDLEGRCIYEDTSTVPTCKNRKATLRFAIVSTKRQCILWARQSV